jgi:hypothetical protein
VRKDLLFFEPGTSLPGYRLFRPLRGLENCIRGRMDAVDEFLARSAPLRAGLQREEGIVFLLTQHLPLQRALRALGHAGLTCFRA